jgi:hypothetical protein
MTEKKEKILFLLLYSIDILEKTLMLRNKYPLLTSE